MLTYMSLCHLLLAGNNRSQRSKECPICWQPLSLKDCVRYMEWRWILVFTVLFSLQLDLICDKVMLVMYTKLGLPTLSSQELLNDVDDQALCRNKIEATSTHHRSPVEYEFHQVRLLLLLEASGSVDLVSALTFSGISLMLVLDVPGLLWCFATIVLVVLDLCFDSTRVAVLPLNIF